MTQIHQNVLSRIQVYEQLETAKRNKAFEIEQMRTLPKDKFTIRVVTPLFAKQALFERGQGTVYIDNQKTSKLDPHLYTVQYGVDYFHFKRLNQLLLWLYRRADVGIQYRHTSGTMCLILARACEQAYKGKNYV